jgi:hypothetical protein
MIEVPEDLPDDESVPISAPRGMDAAPTAEAAESGAAG